MSMNDGKWEQAEIIAAEMAIKEMNAAQFARTVAHIINHRPVFSQLVAWLDEVAAAEEQAPLTDSTPEYPRAVRNVVKHLGTITHDVMVIAEILGWIERLMRYYRVNLSEAQKRLA